MKSEDFTFAIAARCCSQNNLQRPRPHRRFRDRVRFGSVGLILCVGAAAFCLAGPARAAIVLGNLPASNEIAGPDMGSFGGLQTEEAVKFTMKAGSDMTVNNVILRAKTNAAGTNIPAIEIRNDAGTKPGSTVLLTIDGVIPLPIVAANPGTLVQDYKLTATSAFTLTGNTTYWLVVKAKAGTYEWWQSNPSISPTGPSATFNAPYKISSDGGLTWTDNPAFFGSAFFSFQINGSPPQSLQNISTRLKVGSGANVMIGGFILTGTQSKKVILRAIGPSLTAAGVTGALADPTLELHDDKGAIIASNDDWKVPDQAIIQATGIPPTDDHESAIVATLAPDSYTAIVRGKNNTTGIALVEVYDLDAAADSQLANISTRGFIDTGENVMIGGFIAGGNGGVGGKILVRGLGPSLTAFHVPGALADPTLELHDGNGDLITRNDNWKDTQEAEIQATGIPPADDKEAAILATVADGSYTVIVRGKNNTTGIGLVEVYQLP